MYHKVTIIGNLGRDPEMRYTPSGTAVTDFSVATNRSWKNKATGEWEESAQFHNIVLWGEQAERLKDRLHTGTLVHVEGRIETRKYTGKDGNERYITEIIADKVMVLKEREGSTASPATKKFDPPAMPQGGDVEVDDLPF